MVADAARKLKAISLLCRHRLVWDAVVRAPVFCRAPAVVASRGFGQKAKTGRYKPPRASETAQHSPGNLGRLATPRLDGLGADRPSNLHEDDVLSGDAHHEEGPGEMEAVKAMSSAAPVLHKHAALVRGFDEPLPLTAFGDEDDQPLEPMAAAWGGESRALRPPLEHRPRAPLGLLQRLAEVEKAEKVSSAGRSSSSKKRGQFLFSEEEPIRVRVLDVDALPLQELHLAFMHSLVRRRPAEVCIRVASRIASFRDRYGHHAYENMLRDCAQLFGPTHGPELLALFARCHSTISVPFMLDYTRKYGHFSRRFIAEQVEKSLHPAFFDFLRYESKGGVRPLPLLVSKPWSLNAYTRLLSKSYLKSRLHEQLKLHGHVPEKELREDADSEMPVEARVAEQLSTAGSLRVSAPSRPSKSKSSASADSDEAARPALMDAILQAEYYGGGWNPGSMVDQREKPSQPIKRGAKLAMAEAGLEEEPSSDGEDGRMEFDDEDDEELVSDDERGSADRFGLQFEHVVPDRAYGVSADDGVLVNTSKPSDSEFAMRGDELEAALPDRWWSRLRRHFFRHDYRAYRLIDGQWQRVADPRGARYKPRKRHRPRLQKKEEKLRRTMRAARS